jgi:hypothetical protein
MKTQWPDVIQDESILRFLNANIRLSRLLTGIKNREVFFENSTVSIVSARVGNPQNNGLFSISTDSRQ